MIYAFLPPFMGGFPQRRKNDGRASLFPAIFREVSRGLKEPGLL